MLARDDGGQQLGDLRRVLRLSQTDRLNRDSWLVEAGLQQRNYVLRSGVLSNSTGDLPSSISSAASVARNSSSVTGSAVKTFSTAA